MKRRKSSPKPPDPPSQASIATDYTPPQARLLLAAGRANLARHLKDGGKLTAGQEKNLMAIAAADASDKAPEGYVLKLSDLARRLGLHRNTVCNRSRDPDHPPRAAGLGWNLTQCRLWYQAKGIIRAGGGNLVHDAMLRKIEADARKEEARATILTAKAKVTTGALLPIEEVTDELTNIIGEVIARLRAQVPADTLRTVDDCLADLAKLEWLDAELKKKLRQLGNVSAMSSKVSFIHRVDSTASPGSVPMCDLEPPIPVPGDSVQS
jgi:hypothetical protein